MPSTFTSDAARRAELATSLCANEVLGAFANDDVSSLFSQDLRQIPTWAARLDENTAGRQPAGAPVLVWQGSEDFLTPAAMNAEYVQAACSHGSTVKYDLYQGADHGSVFAAAHDDVLAFFADRVKGSKPRNDCG